MIAILFVGGAAGEEIGVGAILGSPFMLATLALFVTGLAVLLYRRRRKRGSLSIDGRLIRRDLKFFLVAYTIAALTAFVPEEYDWVRWIVGCSLIPLYVYYTWVTLRTGESCAESDCKDLYLHQGWDRLNGKGPSKSRAPNSANDNEDRTNNEQREAVHQDGPNLPLVLIQLFMGLTGIIIGAIIFVDQVEALAAVAGISATILALIIAPIATELPEMFNSYLWVKGGKDTYAIGNITGAMVFQSCFPVTIGVSAHFMAHRPERTYRGAHGRQHPHRAIIGKHHVPPRHRHRAEAFGIAPGRGLLCGVHRLGADPNLRVKNDWDDSTGIHRRGPI